MGFHINIGPFWAVLLCTFFGWCLGLMMSKSNESEKRDLYVKNLEQEKRISELVTCKMICESQHKK